MGTKLYGVQAPYETKCTTRICFLLVWGWTCWCASLLLHFTPIHWKIPSGSETVLD